MNAVPRASATFRPRPMKDRESWALEGNVVSGEGKAIDLAAVTRVYYSDTRQSNRQQSLRLRMLGPDNKLTIACLSKSGYEGRVACKGLYAGILQRLHEVNPDVDVHIEGGPAKQLLTFVLTLVLTIATLAMFIAGLLGGQLILAIIGFVVTLGFGYYSFYISPWPSTKFERSPIDAANHILAA